MITEEMLEDLYSREGIRGVKALLDELDKKGLYLSTSAYEADKKTAREVNDDVNIVLSFMMRKTFKKSDRNDRRYSNGH